MIGKMPEQPTADRPYDETNCKQHSGIQLLYDGIISGKKGTGEIQRECRVCIKIVPLDKITDRPDENRLEPAPYIGNLEAVVADGNGYGHQNLVPAGSTALKEKDAIKAGIKQADSGELLSQTRLVSAWRDG